MEEKSEKKEFKSLFSKYIFHIIIFIFIFMTHIIIYLKIYWGKNIIKLLFFYLSMIQIIYIFVPINSFILIKLNHFNSRIEIFKKIGKIFMIISIVFGIFFSVLIIINTVYGKQFRNECPFNLSNDFYSGFYEYFSKNESNNELKDKCQEVRCILIEYSQDFKYPYKYLCNYNPKEYFSDKFGEPYSRSLSNGTELKTYNMIECSLIGPIDNYYFNNEIIIDYLNICYFLGDFYFCERFEEPKKYNTENIKECPNKNYVFIHGILCAYIIIFDIFISFIPWLLEDKSYNSLLIIIEEEFSNINDNDNIKNKKNNNNFKNCINNKKNNIKTSTNNSINNNNNDENQINNNNQLKNKSSLHHTKWTSIISNTDINYKKDQTKFLYRVTKSIYNNNKNIENNENEDNNIDNNINNNAINIINDNNNGKNKKEEDLIDNEDNEDNTNKVKTYAIKNKEKLNGKDEEDNEEEKKEGKKSFDINNRNIDKKQII